LRDSVEVVECKNISLDPVCDFGTRCPVKITARPLLSVTRDAESDHPLQSLRPLVTFLSLTLLIFSSPSFAESEADASVLPASEISVLPSVLVLGTFSNPATGSSVMEHSTLEKMPGGNGSINEILRLFPDVQIAEGFRTTHQAGEILPPAVSIAGGKTYQNNFLIDGVGNNSLLDPARETVGVNLLPGHPQALYLDAALLEAVTVYDSNIPARYGGFTGGVVEAQTRDPRSSPGGRLSYRTTRADWTRFHLGEMDRNPIDFQKHDAGVELEIPLTASMGILGSYRQLYSRIPQQHFGASETQIRRLENIFLKHSWILPEGELRLSVAATPYEARNFIPNVRNSTYLLEGGGAQGALQYDIFFPRAEIQLKGAYQVSRSSREAPRDLRAWAVTENRPWGGEAGIPDSLEGGFGDIETRQEAVTLRTAVLLEPLRTGFFVHTPSAGVALETIRGTFDRKETTRVYFGPKLDPDVICGMDDYGCIDDEQYFTARRTFPRGAVSARVNLVDLFLEDHVQTGRFSVRPGVRLSYDDFMENLNAAPRLAATYDLFADGNTVFIGGINRYYGRTLLTYKLREALHPSTLEYRSTFQGILQSWNPDIDGGADVSRFSRLATPYSDEITFGLDQSFLFGRLSLKYVLREGKDEFAREYGPRQPDGVRISTLTNRGRSRHESLRMSWERDWLLHFLMFNITWQESTVSNESYDDILAEEEVSSRIWFGGKVIEKDELPRKNYNRPWLANLIYTGEFPYGISFTNVTRYRSGYRTIIDTRENRVVPGGEGMLDPFTGESVFEALPVFREEKLSGGVVFDWVLGWRIPPIPALRLTVEVENVFDSQLATGTARHDYELGRQFWAGAEYRF
jgi:hypothetical protein